MSIDSDYELKVLLELRSRDRQDAEADYAEKLAAYHQAGQLVRTREEELRRLIELRRKRCREFDEQIIQGPGMMARLHEFDHFVEGMRDDEARAQQRIEEAHDEQRRAQRAMRKSHEQMLEAIKALKAVEKHHEKWKKEAAILHERKQSAQMDDVAARLWREQRL